MRVRPTITNGQIQIDKVREALLSGKDAAEVEDVAIQYCNKSHLKSLRRKINKNTHSGRSDIEAIRSLKEDLKHGLDENLIM